MLLFRTYRQLCVAICNNIMLPISVEMAADGKAWGIVGGDVKQTYICGWPDGENARMKMKSYRRR